MDILVRIVFVMAVTTLGYLCLALVDRRRALDIRERAILAFPCGIGAAGALLFTLNIVGIPFAPPLVWTVLGAGAIGGLMAAWRDFRLRHCAEPNPETGGHSALTGQSLTLLGALALLIALILIGGYTASSMIYLDWQGDTQMYHFPYAAVVFRTHHQPGFATLASTEEFSFPPALFVVYAAQWTCMGHIDQLLPNLLPVLLTFCWMGLTFLAVRRILAGSSDAAAFAILLFCSLYEMHLLAAGENTDLLPAVLASGSLYLMGCDIRDCGRSRLPVVVFLLGLYTWTKYHGLPFAVCLVAAVVVLSARKLHSRGVGLRGSRATILRAGWVLLGTFAWALPLFLRNALKYGNPIYPGGGRWLGGYLATPWAVNVVGAWWQPHELFHEFSVVLWTGLREPALIFGIPGLLFVWRRGIRSAIFVGLAACFYLILFAAILSNRTPDPYRFVAPALAPLCWLGGCLMDGLRAPAKEHERSASTLLAGWCAATLFLVLIDRLLTGSHAFHLPHGSWMAKSNLILIITQLFWILPLGAGVAVFGWEKLRRMAPELGPAFALLVVSLMALGYHRPFVGIVYDERVGVLPHPDWGRAPASSGVLRWMQDRLPPETVVYTFYPGRWAIPGAMLPPDDPLLFAIHQPGMKMDEVVECLRRIGVDYILYWNVPAGFKIYDAYRSEPVLGHLTHSRYFRLIRSDPGLSLYRVEYPAGEAPCRPTTERPMPWLLDFAAHGPIAAR